MRSLLGRFHRPFARSADEQLLLMNNLGDGSTLSLDFTTMGNTLDPRLTFTRGSNATFINSSGLVEWAAANFMTQSNNFAVSPWSSTNVTMSIDGSSPVGDAWKMLENNVNNVHRLDPSGVSYGNNGLPVTFSVYVKQGSGSRQAYFTISDNATGDVRSKRLNPVTGLLEGSESVGGSWTNASTSVQSVGGGWYRLVLTATKNAGTAVICRTGMSDSSGNLSYTGDSTSFLYFAGYQINPGTSAQPYNATTGSAYTAPRFDYDPTTIGSPRGLLIEGSATNICTYSGDLTQSGAGHWSVRTALITTSWTGFTAPDGTATAVKIIPDTTSSRHTIESSSTTVVSGTTYTASAFVKASGYTVASLVIAAGQTRRNFTLSGSGTVGSQFGLTNTATITPVGSNGWYRITMTWTANATGGAGLWIGVPQNATTDVVSSWSGDGTSAIQAWGAQLETGSGESSYIPTGASQGSRAADNLEVTGTNFSSWWPNPTAEFTVQWIGDLVRSPATAQFIWLSRAGGTSKARNYVQTNSVIRGNSSVVDFTMSPATTATVGVVFKTAMAVKSGDSAMYVNNGTTIGNQADATSGTTTNHDSMYFNANADNFMHLKQFKFWPLRLPNATLQALVS